MEKAIGETWAAQTTREAKAIMVAWAAMDGDERGYVYDQIGVVEQGVAQNRRRVDAEMKAMGEMMASGTHIACGEGYLSDLSDRRDRLLVLANIVTAAKAVLAAAFELGNVFAQEEDEAKAEAELDADAAKRLAAREALVGKWGYYDEKTERADGPYESKDAAMLAAIEHTGFSLVRGKLADCPELARLSFEPITVMRPEDHTPDVEDVLDTIRDRIGGDIALDDGPEIRVYDGEAASAELAAMMKRWCDRHVIVDEPEWIVTTAGEQITEADIARLAKPDARQMSLPHVEGP